MEQMEYNENDKNVTGIFGGVDMLNSTWEIICDKYNSNESKKFETLFTTANGYRGLRGALEFSKFGERGNFIAGVFDKSTAQVEEIVNCQDPLPLNIYIENELIDIDRCRVFEFKRSLNMMQGILYLNMKLETREKKIIGIYSERFVSRNNVHRWGTKYIITPINFSGRIFIESIIDGTITNNTSNPVEITKHFNVSGIYNLNPGIALETTINDKKTRIIEGTLLMTDGDGKNIFESRRYDSFCEKVRELYELYVKEGQEVSFYKFGITYTSRDTGESLYKLIQDEMDAFLKEGYDAEKDKHIAAWGKLWETIDIKIEGDLDAQAGIRFNLFHLASCAYGGDDRVSIAAKGLHGQGYKGHVFWDTETFMIPFFIYTMPDTAEKLLMYRYNTLNGARRNAGQNGYKGAQFAWESADDGLEVTPKWGFGYNRQPIRIWTGDEEFHISFDIVFAICEYFRATGNKKFMMDYGLEILMDVARFCRSLVQYNKSLDRYDINKVIGPDEFHEHVNNNVYTNYLAKWSLKKAVEFARWAREEDAVAFHKLCNRLGITGKDFSEWEEVQEKIHIPRGKTGRLIEQFEGYFNLKDIEIKKYDENGMPEWPELNGCNLGDTQLIKQPDVVMLMLMLPEEFDEEIRRENYEYYEKRTMHKSSLSPSMYSIMGLSVGDTHNAYRYFMKAVRTDLEDNQGNTEQGLHAASAGGSWQSAVYGFGGFYIDGNGIVNFNPWIPENWKQLSFNIIWRNIKINVAVGKESVKILADSDTEIRVYGRNYKINKDLICTINREK